MYARVTNIRFPPDMKAEVSRVAQGLAPILKQQRGFNGFQVLTDPNAGEGIIVSFGIQKPMRRRARPPPLISVR